MVNDDLDEFFKQLAIFFANIPNNITLKHEKYYQSLFYALFMVLGFNIDTEVNTNEGRIDCILQTDSKIYIIEFKVKGTKETALQQIKDKNYAQRYANSNKQIMLLGVEFNQQTRNLGDYIVEEYK